MGQQSKINWVFINQCSVLWNITQWTSFSCILFWYDENPFSLISDGYNKITNEIWGSLGNFPQKRPSPNFISYCEYVPSSTITKNPLRYNKMTNY
jgi:hypothetical protein